MERLPASFFENLARPPLHTDPHSRFDELRTMRSPRLATGEFVVVHHADAVAVLRDGRFRKPPIPTPPGPMRVLSQMFILIDGADHQRLRRAVAPLFSPAAVGARSAEISAEADQLLNQIGHLDVIDGYADLLPLRLTGRWLGVGRDDQAEVRTAGKALTDALDAPVPTSLRHTLRFVRAVLARRARPVASARAVSALVRLASKRFAEAEAGHVAPGAIFLEELAGARQRGDIDREEAVATWILLLIAGYETTANLIGTAMYHLLERPDLLGRVRSDPTRIAAVIEETLRFDGPVPVTARIASEDIELPSGTVASGQMVIVALIAANRDPAVFEEPNVFNIDRDASRHLGFALGAHFCLGAHLARAEARTALEALLKRNPRSAGTATWRQAFGTRGVANLPVDLDAM